MVRRLEVVVNFGEQSGVESLAAMAANLDGRILYIRFADCSSRVDLVVP